MPTSETFLDVISLDHMWAASDSETGTAPGGGTRDRMEFESITISKPIKNQYYFFNESEISIFSNVIFFYSEVIQGGSLFTQINIMMSHGL